MLRKTFLCFCCIFIIIILPGSVAAESGFTQQDRELLIELRLRMLEIDKRFEQVDRRFEQVDKRFEELREDMNKRFEQIDRGFEQVDQRFGMLMNFLYILSGIFTTLVIFVIGFAYWDRRTIIKKAKEDTLIEVENITKNREMLFVMKKFSEYNADFARVMKECNLL